MLDLKNLRDNFDDIKKMLSSRGYNIDEDSFKSLDKKRKDNSNTFILIDDIGSAIIKDGISDDYLKSFMISNGFK